MAATALPTQVTTVQDSTEALLHFWEGFQEAVREGKAEAIIPYVHFPLHTFGRPIERRTFSQYYPDLMGGHADSLLRLIRPQDLQPTDLTPYGMQGLDHPAGYSTLLSQPGGDENMSLILFIGKVKKQYYWVGYLESHM